jgi:hypothetical protein
VCIVLTVLVAYQYYVLYTSVVVARVGVFLEFGEIGKGTLLMGMESVRLSIPFETATGSVAGFIWLYFCLRGFSRSFLRLGLSSTAV